MEQIGNLTLDDTESRRQGGGDAAPDHRGVRGTVDQCAGATVVCGGLERSNMQRAYDRVMRNKGAPGVDGLTVADLKGYLKVHWPRHRQELLEGTYQPQPVRAVEIHKPGGGVRQLGIPTVLDRLIQQALHQILSPVFEPGFSESRYGFRPGRNAGQAVKQARDFVEAGYHWVVDIDLEAFLDRVNHDMLMARVARQVKDKRVLKRIRGYLEAGICTGEAGRHPTGWPLVTAVIQHPADLSGSGAGKARARVLPLRR